MTDTRERSAERTEFLKHALVAVLNEGRHATAWFDELGLDEQVQVSTARHLSARPFGGELNDDEWAILALITKLADRLDDYESQLAGVRGES